MFNPLYLLSNEVLEATVKRGCIYFVRNNYPNAFNPLAEGIKANLLLSHYDDLQKAQEHFNSIPQDVYRFLYHWNNPEHQSKLKIAASQPKGYAIYSTYFYPNYKTKITPRLKEKINSYMYSHTRWNPKKGETVNIDFHLQFGALFVTMQYAGKKIQVRFIDIEKQQ